MSIVPLGPRQMIGVVWALKDEAETDEEAARRGGGLRHAAHAGDAPATSSTGWRPITSNPPGNVLRMVLRAPGAFEGPREQIAYRATESVPKRMTPQRARVLEIAREGFAMRAAELAEAAGVGTSVIKALAKDGALEAVALPALKRFPEPDLNAGGYGLSNDQQEAAQALARRRRAAPAQGDAARRRHRLGQDRSLFRGHGGGPGGRAARCCCCCPRSRSPSLPRPRRAPLRLRAGAMAFRPPPARARARVARRGAMATARIVVGARSALFLPWKKLGLIVVDEEHESAYKQDDGVPYHARDMAVLYGSIGKFPVMLSSATPSLETLVNVDRGRYGVVRLNDRHGRPELPEIGLIDMKRVTLGAGTWISPPLFEAVKTTLGERRPGAAVPQPPRLCAAHPVPRLRPPAGLPQLRRLAGRAPLPAAADVPPLRPSRTDAEGLPELPAEGKMVPVGPGVERLAEEAAARFPQARIAILSSDLSRGTLLRDAIRDVEEGEYNLVIGTQLVAKGHHFPHLTLVGVVDADLALESSDPRGGERTWALMAQVAGRAGRGEKPGRALVQTYLPEHPLMQALKKGDRDSYLNQEKAIRENAGLPPYGRLAAIIISGNDAAETERFARASAMIAPLADGITVLGPAAAPIAMVRGRHRLRFLVKAGARGEPAGLPQAVAEGRETQGLAGAAGGRGPV